MTLRQQHLIEAMETFARTNGLEHELAMVRSRLKQEHDLYHVSFLFRDAYTIEALEALRDQMHEQFGPASQPLATIS